MGGEEKGRKTSKRSECNAHYDLHNRTCSFKLIMTFFPVTTDGFREVDIILPILCGKS